MKKFFKYLLYTILGLFLLLSALLAGFIYKVKNGFPVSYETEKPALNFPANQPAVLLFSKTTGFRHGEAIEASKDMFSDLAQKHRWFLYETEAGGVFNVEQLAKFGAVIFNNSTGRVLNPEQQKALEQYVESGGCLIGIHGAGDDSHHWDWYEKNLLGAKFSHHPIEHQLQETSVHLQTLGDSLLWQDLAKEWTHTDEWYVFFDDPLKKGFTGVYAIDGEAIDPSGNLLWIKSKNFGMGPVHPVAWFKKTGQGHTFYTSMGHTGATFKQAEFIQLIENALNWGMQ
jgi:uncharacterized protein